MFARIVCSVFVIGLIAGCGNTSSGPVSALQNLGGTTFAPLGNGRFISSQGLSDSNADANYRLRAIIRDKGKLTLVSHATDALANGVDVVCERDGNVVNVSINGLQLGTINKPAADVVELQVEIHNGEGADSAHILIADSVTATEGTLYNSEDMPLARPAKGKGDKWGVILNDVEPVEFFPARGSVFGD